ncbi:MAG: efflux transporter periplasmic adaptor subunit, partial [Bacteroidaceae bacterium]|nr:efflux transporter periplasmic adaptor subunit [Bacteroidaceae bacterium]
MKKALKIAALVVVALIFIGTFVFLYQKSQPKVTVYDLLETHIDTIRRTSVVTGTIEPRNEVAIKPQITGIIAEIYKEAGQSVAKGEVIAKVKVIPDMSSLNAAESRVRLAKLNNQQAQADYNRAEKLYADRLISTEEMEKARLALHQQREELKSATDALQIAKEGVSASMADLSTTLIRSTIDGLILDIPVKVGNSV